MQLPLLPLPLLQPLPLPAIPTPEYSPWYPLTREPWEAGFYEVKDADGVAWAERFFWTPSSGWGDELPGAVIAWRGKAAP